jgi:hypothetical protein
MSSTTPKRHTTARASCAVIALSLVVGCGPSAAQKDTKGGNSAKPDAYQLRLALNASYATPLGGKQECLGRLVLDVGSEMQWGVSSPDLNGDDQFRFAKGMSGGQDYAGMGNVKVIVLKPAKWTDIERMTRALEANKAIAIHQYQTDIATDQSRIADFESVLADPSKNVNNEDTSRFPESIAEIKRTVAELETRIANIRKDWHPLDLGLPDSLGYAAGPTLYAFLLREGRAYQFMSTGGPGEPRFEERERAFRELLQRFQVRGLHQIPKVPGICIPYGFIPDDGRGHFRIEVSLRYADRPGVIYTIGTAVPGERGVDGPEPALLQATARAAAGTLSGLGQGREVKSLGPRPASIGALPAYQGGISLNVSEPGQPPVRSYSVYTGYGGWMHSRVLPNITVNMRSFTKEQEPTLKSDPPPFEESLARLDALLKSIRLRPTEPVMPELLGTAEVSK